MKNSKLHHLPPWFCCCACFPGWGPMARSHPAATSSPTLQRPCPHGSARAISELAEFAFSPTPRGALPKLGLGVLLTFSGTSPAGEHHPPTDYARGRQTVWDVPARAVNTGSRRPETDESYLEILLRPDTWHLPLDRSRSLNSQIKSMIRMITTISSSTNARFWWN